MKTWLSVVAPQVNYQQCCETAKVGLASGNELHHYLAQSVEQFFVTQLSELAGCRLNMDVLFVIISGLSMHFC